MLKTLKAYIDEETGATSMEYVLMAALIGVAVIAGMSILGAGLGTEITEIADEVDETF